RRRNTLVAPDGRGSPGGRQPCGRVAELPAPQDRLFGAEGELAVRTGTDAQVVAEAPIVEVVRALAPRARIGRHLVLRVARLGQQRLAVLLHVPGQVLVGN